MKNLILAAPVILFTLAGFACGEDEKLPPKVAGANTTTTHNDTASAGMRAAPNNDKMDVNVDNDIVKACNIKFENPVEQAPKFDFNSDELTPGEKNVLEAVAKCLTTGPLTGRTVDLVGRADPRGETEYNMTLGAKRARQVHTYLGHLGVQADKMRETSRGALDATGKDEEGWRKDRRVDIRLTK
ncbi:MAG: OmpA family protein [Polyangiaceae bacterium]|nr:OmpA family protein [Polyangiaceae bacterium]